MLQNLLEIASHNRIRIPPAIFLMIKAFAALEGIARLLDPEFDIIAHAQPFVKRAKLARYSPGRLAENLFTTVYDSLNVLQELPREMLQLTKLIRQNKMTINMEMRWIDTFLRDLDQARSKFLIPKYETGYNNCFYALRFQFLLIP